ncbi:hypothetical protein M513_03283 [Trichuris suis]|uniref:Uncharacterized protein n=1 Tax=Trichuris suis TaxID=68888 RepID=A0A085MF48_9BILA|nr:hypothetical protein M513_03283 [Trichuris suis]
MDESSDASPEEEEEEEEEPEFSLVNNVTFNGMPRHNGMFSLFRHSDKWGKDSMYPTLIRAAVLDLDDPFTFPVGPSSDDLANSLK